METKTAIISLFSLVFFSFVAVSQDERGDIWILYDKSDSLCHKGGDGEDWMFFEDSLYSDVICFCIKEKPVKPDTLFKILPDIKFTTRKELFSIRETKDTIIYTNKEKTELFIDFNWFNKLYNNIFIIELMNGYWLIYRVEFVECIV